MFVYIVTLFLLFPILLFLLGLNLLEQLHLLLVSLCLPRGLIPVLPCLDLSLLLDLLVYS